MAVAATAWLGAWAIRMLRATSRLRFHDEAEVRRLEADDRRFIIAFWHRHLLMMRYCYRGRRISVLISQSRDGELIARTIERLGIATARGSSSRGAVAGLRALLRQARAGEDIAFTPDGPRGPRGVVQPGVLLAAQATGWPIVPVALAASRAKRLRSWDRMVVPLPFGRVHYVYGPSLTVERGADQERAAAELKTRLDAAEDEAERRAGAAAAPRGED